MLRLHWSHGNSFFMFYRHMSHKECPFVYKAQMSACMSLMLYGTQSIFLSFYSVFLLTYTSNGPKCLQCRHTDSTKSCWSTNVLPTLHFLCKHSLELEYTNSPGSLTIREMLQMVMTVLVVVILHRYVPVSLVLTFFRITEIFPSFISGSVRSTRSRKYVCWKCLYICSSLR